MVKKNIFGQQTTKVKQLADMIAMDIMKGKYDYDNSLPSINSLSSEYKVSRDTVFKAFMDLKERHLIDSTPGKGYYVVNERKTIFLLLDEYSPFKNTLYNSLARKLFPKYKIDLWFHQYNEHIFNTIMREAIGRYNYYIVMNFDNEKISPLLTKIMPSKLLLLDFGKFEKGDCSYICQNFDDEFYKALTEMKDGLTKYSKIVFHFPSDSKHPKSAVDSLKAFCDDNGLLFEVRVEQEIENVEKGVVYIVIRQTDVVDVIKKSRNDGLKCGVDFGIIAYNDTPAYEVIDNGITAFSIDWEEMARLASRFILFGETVKCFLPTLVKKRNSV